MHISCVALHLTVAFHCYVISGVGLDPSKPPPKKAKQLRLERKLAKQSQKVIAGDSEMLPVSIIVLHQSINQNVFSK